MLITISVFAQWDIEEGFEGETFPPTGWTVINANGGDTWILNTNSSYAHTGSNSVGMPGSFNPADEWLITPQVSVQSGDKFILWARSHYTYSESFNVMLSTSCTAVEDFTVTLGSESIGWETYSEFEYDLSSYTGDVYLAIQCITEMTTGLYVDDVKVGQDQPTQIYIPADYPTLHEGLNAANTLTTVIVSAGTYFENIEWPNTDGIILLSETGAINTIIDGFTIRNGYYSGAGPHPGGGIVLFYANVGTTVIEDNIIVNNSADGSVLGGGGILVLYSGCSSDYNDCWGNTPDNYAGCLAGSNSISADPVFVVSNNQNYINNL